MTTIISLQLISEFRDLYNSFDPRDFKTDSCKGIPLDEFANLTEFEKDSDTSKIEKGRYVTFLREMRQWILSEGLNQTRLQLLNSFLATGAGVSALDVWGFGKENKDLFAREKYQAPKRNAGVCLDLFNALGGQHGFLGDTLKDILPETFVQLDPEKAVEFLREEIALHEDAGTRLYLRVVEIIKVFRERFPQN